MSAPPLTQLAVSGLLVDQLILLGREGRERHEEVVGLIVALAERANEPGAWMCWPLTNESPTPESTFEVCESSVRRAWEQAEAQGYGVMAFYHSHLRRAANPSSVDIAHAWCPRQFIVFDEARHRDSAVKLWWIEDGAAVQIPLVET